MVRYQNTPVIAGAIVVLVARLATLQPRFATALEVSFGRSLFGFNPFLHQPPPPCYPLYVGMGKFVNFFLHDPLTSLLTLSVVASVATFVFLALDGAPAFAGQDRLKAVLHYALALLASLIPMPTRPLPDATAIACFAAAVYFWRRNPALFGIACAATVGCMPQTIFAILLFIVVVERRLAAWAAFIVMLFVEFLQTTQNIELRRLRAFIAANIELTRLFDPWGARIIAAAVLVALTYHLIRAKAGDLARDPDVQRRGEH